jgi:hypothetical protein
MRPGQTIIGASLVAVTALVYSASLENGFVNFDDDKYVFANSHVQQGLSLANVAWAFRSTECANWHPLTWLSLELDTTLFGPEPWGYHITNLLLHCTNTTLLFYVLEKMTGALGRSALVAAFFGLHPLHVESVAWVSERKDVLCGLFFLLGLVAWLRYVVQPNWRRYGLVLLMLAAGLMAKPMLVTFPCVVLLLDWWPFGRWSMAAEASDLRQGAGLWRQTLDPQPWQRLVLEKLPSFGLVVASSIVTYCVQHQGGAMRSTEQLPPAERLINTPVAYLAYISKTFCPVGLAVYYPHPEGAGSLAEAIVGVVALLAVSSLAVIRARRWPYLFVGWFWWLGMLVPTIGLVQVGSQAYADRYMYLPMIGLLLAVVWSGHALADCCRFPRWLVPMLTAFSLVVCAALSCRQIGFWHDGVSLWRRAVEKAAPNAVAFNSLGVALLERGELPEAIFWLEKALELSPQDERAHLNLAHALIKLRRPGESMVHYRAALHVDPTNPVANFNLGLLLEAEGDTDGAFEHYHRALQADPDDWKVHLQMGKLLFRRGDVVGAEQELAEAARLNPKLLSATTSGNARAD